MFALWNNRTVLEKVLIFILATVVLAACAGQVQAALDPTRLGCEIQSSNTSNNTCPGSYYIVKFWWGNPDGSPGTNQYNNCVVWHDGYRGGIWCPDPK